MRDNPSESERNDSANPATSKGMRMLTGTQNFPGGCFNLFSRITAMMRIMQQPSAIDPRKKATANIVVYGVNAPIRTPTVKRTISAISKAIPITDKSCNNLLVNVPCSVDPPKAPAGKRVNTTLYVDLSLIIHLV